MGSGHNCTLVCDGEELPVASPVSRLDCERPRCKRHAEQAELAANIYRLDYIEQRIEESEAAIRQAMDLRAGWELYREAAMRKASA